MSLIQIIILALVQGAAELLPVSSSAHVIVAEKLMGLDPSAPEMTFLLVMLHSGTMFAVLLYFWPRWKVLKLNFYKLILAATAVTGVVGLGLKKAIEEIVLKRMMGESQGEIEHLFKSLPLIAVSLFSVGVLIIIAGMSERKKKGETPLDIARSGVIGMIQGLCLPFRGFSRSGATISAGMLMGMNRGIAEDFSFALAVVLTPPIVVKEFLRLAKASGSIEQLGSMQLGQLILPGMLGMVFSFIAGYFALRWLSSWLENGRWKYFGFYCLFASVMVLNFYFLGY